MQVVQALAGAAMGVTKDPEIEAARSTLVMCSGFIGFAGVLGAISAWAVYYFGFLLAASTLTVGIVLYNHTSTYDACLHNTCCVNPSNGFSTLNTFCIMNLIGCIIGAIISVIAAIFWNNNGYQTFLIFAVIALVGCLIGGVASAVAISPCSVIHKKIQVQMGAQVVGAVANAVVGGAAVVRGAAQPAQPQYQHAQTYPAAQPVQQAQPVYASNPGYDQTQPTYASQNSGTYGNSGYGQNQGYNNTQPGYGQPAYNNQQQGGYQKTV